MSPQLIEKNRSGNLWTAIVLHWQELENGLLATGLACHGFHPMRLSHKNIVTSTVTIKILFGAFITLAALLVPVISHFKVKVEGKLSRISCRSSFWKRSYKVAQSLGIKVPRHKSDF